MLSGRHNIITTSKIFFCAFVLLFSHALFAAIGCTLTNPAEDLKYLFPAMTSYKEDLREFTRVPDGKKLYSDLQERLGSDLDPIYETYETPYTIYNVFKGNEKIGVVHGVNVPGKGGVIQVFLSTDVSSGDVRKFFFQRLESPAANQLRNKNFTTQFLGLNLSDFYKHDYFKVKNPNSASDKVAKIKEPSGLTPAGKPDYEATLRGIRKNLILLDFFVYNRRFEPFFEKTKMELGTKK